MGHGRNRVAKRKRRSASDRFSGAGAIKHFLDVSATFIIRHGIPVGGRAGGRGTVRRGEGVRRHMDVAVRRIETRKNIAQTGSRRRR